MVQSTMAYGRVRCPRCERDFGQEVRLLAHLTEEHGVTDHLGLFLELNHGSQHPTCGCSPGCDVRLPWAGWKKGFTSRYARGHNARLDSVYLDPDRQAAFVEKRIEGHRTGRNKAWNAGLTKETDARVAAQATNTSKALVAGYASGSIVDWHQKDPDKAIEANRKQAATKRRLFSSGELVPWNKGLTRETSPQMAAIARAISETMTSDANASARRFKLPELERLLAPVADKFVVLSDLKTYRNRHQLLQLRCLACGSEQQKGLQALLVTPTCFSCHPKESKGQLEVLEFVRSLAPDAVSCDREVIRPKEIDVYVPSRRFGIEYNGLYWHSKPVIDDDKYHQAKADACAAAGIRLLSLFEDEWRDRRPIVEGMIRHRLGSPVEKLHARKLALREIDPIERKRFLSSSHLEGDARCSVAFALVEPSSDRIVAAMSLRRPFHKKHDGWIEVARSACLPGVSVSGWLGRLTLACLRWAGENEKLGLMTYVDGRVGGGSGYRAAGWTLDRSSTGPRFWWTDYVQRWDRFKFKADKARGLTQRDVAAEAGVVQVFGCSNSVWKFPVRRAEVPCAH